LDVPSDPNLPNTAKDCLSEGDRSTLALAFFLAKLDIDPALAAKIIVFDDPLSSFDSNRRIHTIELIQKILTRVPQVLVLSHNEFFLAELAKTSPASDRKTLQIREDFIARAASIAPLDLANLVEIEYFKLIKELENFRVSPDITKKEQVLG